jgi:transposase-like protein/ribosomal protein L37AE/L43A
MKAFKSILQFAKTFDTDEKCRAYLEQQRWGDTPACPHCGSINVCRFANGYIFKCREKQCRKKFSVTVGTVYQDRKLPLHKIFLAVYILSVHSKGISALQLANLLDISVKSAWLLNHKVRAMLKAGESELLEGTFEIDETYVGGKERFKHGYTKRSKTPTKTLISTGAGESIRQDDKTPVLGILQRNGVLRVQKVVDAKSKTLFPIMVATVKKDSTIYTDQHTGYNSLANEGYNHETVNHQDGEYVRGAVHTQNLDGYWSLLKRQIVGIHHSVSAKHLQRYCDESAYRYNNRQTPQDERFANVLSNCEGSLQYKELTAE